MNINNKNSGYQNFKMNYLSVHPMASAGDTWRLWKAMSKKDKLVFSQKGGMYPYIPPPGSPKNQTPAPKKTVKQPIFQPIQVPQGFNQYGTMFQGFGNNNN